MKKIIRVFDIFLSIFCIVFLIFDISAKDAVKSVNAASQPQRIVYVSGEAFGIKLYTNGVIVVGTQSVETSEGRINPASEAGIKTGDIIVSINNINVYSSNEVKEILNDNNGAAYKIKLKRDGRYKNFVLNPVFCDREGCWKAGMWVRDSTAGIGTITYYDKKTGTFGALGHQVNDVDTNEIMPLLEGEAVCADVTKIQKASPGITGSLNCDFQETVIGKLLDNSNLGLYGAYSFINENAIPVGVAKINETEKGAAQIISTVEGQTPKKSDIEITRVHRRQGNSQKDIVFRITDKKLLEKTGGIVQGMSGSPIVQNNKLIGAVTHVIVNNPEKGYAVFAETMLEKSDSFAG
ncbi:MAG: SpoIVB peptidase [Eubacterium sp.]|nr:SpoIVB peptidase [Eubacterium sp.]